MSDNFTLCSQGERSAINWKNSCQKLKGLFVVTMAPHSSTLAWKTPWTEEPGRLQSMGSLRVWHDWLHFHFSLWYIGEGNGNPLQCFCLENPRDGGAWWAAVYGVTQSQTRLKWLSSSSSICTVAWFPKNNSFTLFRGTSSGLVDKCLAVRCSAPRSGHLKTNPLFFFSLYHPVVFKSVGAPLVHWFLCSQFRYFISFVFACFYSCYFLIFFFFLSSRTLLKSLICW